MRNKIYTAITTQTRQRTPLEGITLNMEEKEMFGINGLEQNDLGALTPEQQQKLNEFKVAVLFFSRVTFEKMEK